MVEKQRDYIVRKYIRARNAAEAIRLERKHPVCEVVEMQDRSDVQNELTPLIGFHRVPNDYLD